MKKRLFSMNIWIRNAFLFLLLIFCDDICHFIFSLNLMTLIGSVFNVYLIIITWNKFKGKGQNIFFQFDLWMVEITCLFKRQKIRLWLPKWMFLNQFKKTFDVDLIHTIFNSISVHSFINKAYIDFKWTICHLNPQKISSILIPSTNPVNWNECVYTFFPPPTQKNRKVL